MPQSTAAPHFHSWWVSVSPTSHLVPPHSPTMSATSNGTSHTDSATDQSDFKRKDPVFRHHVSADPNGDFPAQPHRYHLYVSLACPWAHLTLVVKRMKGLDAVIAHTVVDCHLERSTGWTFTTGDRVSECEPDPIHGFHRLRQLYEHVSPGYDGVVSVPVLYDKLRDTIVNNESSEIIRMLNCAFNAHCASPQQAALDLYPADLRPAIDATNDWVYTHINNGVYRAGFARSQEAYESAVTSLFEHLDRADTILATQRYLCGDRLTEADVRLFTTLYRFDVAYHGHFKCNLRALHSYTNLYGLLRELYQRADFRPTCNLYHVKHGYYNMEYINPTRIVPVGPVGYEEDLITPHGRDHKLPVQSSL